MHVYINFPVLRQVSFYSLNLPLLQESFFSHVENLISINVEISVGLHSFIITENFCETIIGNFLRISFNAVFWKKNVVYQMISI